MNDQLDRIDYTPAFTEYVKGRLYARFQLDANGEPEFEPDGDDPDLRHYTIDLYLRSPRASEIDGVEYYMNDPTYWDPEGYSEDEANDFHEVIESYGDVPIDVTVRIIGREYKQRAWLAAMLVNGYLGEMGPAVTKSATDVTKTAPANLILDAIARIKAN